MQLLQVSLFECVCVAVSVASEVIGCVSPFSIKQQRERKSEGEKEKGGEGMRGRRKGR